MDKKYIELFTLISQSAANIAEQVMNLHVENVDDDKSVANAEIMRDNFLNLHDKIVNNQNLTKADYAQLFIGATLVANQLNNRILVEQNALQGYNIDVIPKLDRVLNSDEPEKLASELFKISETNI